MLVRDLHHVSINVTDVERATAFYVGVLGMERLARPDFGFAGAWLGVGGGRQVHLIQATVPDDVGQHFAFAVDDIDAAVEALRAAGTTVRGPVPVADTAARQAFLHDPDGNRLELNQPPKPART
jgi:glyoxylase I family protein